MKQKLFLANWKMSLTPSQALALAKEYQKLKINQNQEVSVFPSFSALGAVGGVLGKTKIQLGAQDVFWQDHGAYTGEESVLSLKELGVKSVLVGHSERRQYCGETQEMINQKVVASLEAGLRPVICVGETFDQRKDGQKDFVVMSQLESALANLELALPDRLVVAYEPVWMIGSGQAIAAEEIWYTLEVIRHFLISRYSATVVSNQIWLIYGGSVADDDTVLFDHEVVEGVLVGGASLSADEFNKILGKAQ